MLQNNNLRHYFMKPKEAHDNSLMVEELIMKVMPILDGPPSKGIELELLGGYGLSKA